MLEDYKRYLTNVRNNLIQCGVEFPITPLDDYRDLFRLGLQLDSVLWYYSILAISGSENALRGYFLPLSNYYKEQMRQKFYKEFLDYVPDYRKLSSLSNLLVDLGGEELISLNNIVPKSTIQEDEVIDLFEKPEEVLSNVLQIEPESGKLSEMVEVPLFMPEVTGDILPSEPELPLPISIEFDDEEMVEEFNEEDVVHGIDLDLDFEDIISEEPSSEDTSEEVVEGIDLDAIESEIEEVHGIYIDELEEDEEDIPYTYQGIDLDDFSASNESEPDVEPELEEVHGLYIDDEDFCEDSTEDEDFYEEDDEEDNPFIIEYEDDFHEESRVEEVEEIIFFEENGIQYSNHGLYVEDYVEEESYNEDSSYSEEYMDDEDYSVPEVDWSSDEDLSEEVPMPTVEPSKPKEPVQTKDMSDLLQDWTNSILTKGKKSLLGSINKLKDD